MTDTPTTASWAAQRNKLLPASMIGTILEWYDVFVYAQAASLIFSTLFFPKFSETAGTLASLATFGVGYAARPLGAVIFGHIGDKHGRKIALSLTLILMGVSTTLIGVLPTYGSVGLWAPAMLVVLRLLQGVGSGAEYAGSFVMVAEFAPPKRRGFITSLPGTGVYMGIVLATIVALTVFHLPEAALYSYGWRLPFLGSVVLIVVGLVLRLRIAESPVFEKTTRVNSVHRVPALTILRESPGKLVLALLLTAPIAFNAYVSSTYALTYGVANGATKTGVLWGALVGAFTAFLLVPVAGRLTDRFGRRPVFMTMTIIAALTTVPYFLLLGHGNGTYWLGQVLVMAPFTQALTGAQAAFLAELFEPRFRYTGVALSREFSTAILTSTAPIVAIGLVSAMGGRPWLLAGVMSAVSLLGCLGAYLLPETRGKDMAADHESDAVASTTITAEGGTGERAVR